MAWEQLDLQSSALLLDVDGTLLDIAPTPQEVKVPPSLPCTLLRLMTRAAGALALVSGRPITELDAFFAPLRLSAIGGHGAEMRPIASGEIINRRVAPLDADLKNRLKDIAAWHRGVLVEDKGYSLALHYRLVPDQGLALVHDIKHALEAWNDPSLELLSGKAVLEIKFAGFNKGTAVRQLMTYPPFAGRAPIFVGDDRTDEDAFAVMPELKGRAVSVGRKFPGVHDHFKSPKEVRCWLERLSQGAGGP